MSVSRATPGSDEPMAISGQIRCEAPGPPRRSAVVFSAGLAVGIFIGAESRTVLVAHAMDTLDMCVRVSERAAQELQRARAAMHSMYVRPEPVTDE